MSEDAINTTFIPKQPVGRLKTDKGVKGAKKRKPKKEGGVSVLMYIAKIVLGITLIASAAIYGYAFFLKTQISDLEKGITPDALEIEPSVIIEIENINTRITETQSLLSNHSTVAPIFQLLQILTLKKVSYTNFTYERLVEGVAVNMYGIATDYESISNQSDIFRDEDLISNFAFSDFTLEENGDIGFKLTLNIAEALYRYEESLGRLPADVFVLPVNAATQ